MGIRNILILFFSTMAVSLVVLIVLFNLLFTNLDMTFKTRVPESAPTIEYQDELTNKIQDENDLVPQKQVKKPEEAKKDEKTEAAAASEMATTENHTKKTVKNAVVRVPQSNTHDKAIARQDRTPARRRSKTPVVAVEATTPLAVTPRATTPQTQPTETRRQPIHQPTKPSTLATVDAAPAIRAKRHRTAPAAPLPPRITQVKQTTVKLPKIQQVVRIKKNNIKSTSASSPPIPKLKRSLIKLKHAVTKPLEKAE